MNDLISRQAAIKAIGNLYPDMPKIEFLDNRSLWRQKYEQYINAQQTIRDLPSVPVNYGSTNLIDRGALIDWIIESHADWCVSPVRSVFDHIKEMQTVDAVPVVRCKDCKHYWRNNPKWSEGESIINSIIVCLASPQDNAFCSEGERREDETH